MQNIFEKFKVEIESSTLDEETKKVLLDKVEDVKNKKINILIVGATGVGKSSTINALFGKKAAVVGEGVDSETKEIEQYVLGNIVLWDTPGLGDSPEKDRFFANNIIELLNEKNEDGNAIIDVVLVVVDSSAREMGTTYELINQVIIPNIIDTSRILVALNQCDFAMKGKYWDHITNSPKDKLKEVLQEKVDSVQKRIKEATNVDVEPIYYSALYRYNISKLFLYMLESTPEEKRMIYTEQLNQDPKVWQTNDDLHNYNEAIKGKMEFSFMNAFKGAIAGAQIGAKIGKIVPVIGPIVGGGVGAFIGFLDGMRKK